MWRIRVRARGCRCRVVADSWTAFRRRRQRGDLLFDRAAEGLGAGPRRDAAELAAASKDKERRNAVQAEARRHRRVLVDVVVQPADLGPAEALGRAQDFALGDVAVHAVVAPEEEHVDPRCAVFEHRVQRFAVDATHREGVEEMRDRGVCHAAPDGVRDVRRDVDLKRRRARDSRARCPTRCMRRARRQWMDEDTRAFAQRMVDASWRDWSTWLTTRMNDIARLEHGVKVAAFRVLEGASRIEDLEHLGGAPAATPGARTRELPCGGGAADRTGRQGAKARCAGRMTCFGTVPRIAVPFTVSSRVVESYHGLTRVVARVAFARGLQMTQTFPLSWEDTR